MGNHRQLFSYTTPPNGTRRRKDCTDPAACTATVSPSTKTPDPCKADRAFSCGVVWAALTRDTLTLARCAPGDIPEPRIWLRPCLMAGLHRPILPLNLFRACRSKNAVHGVGQWTKDGGLIGAYDSSVSITGIITTPARRQALSTKTKIHTA